MSSTYHIDPDRGLILVRLASTLTEATFLDTCRAVYNDPERDPAFSTVWDGRSIDEIAVGASIIPMYKEFLQENTDRLTRNRVALIANRDVVATFASMLAEISKTHVAQHKLFESMEAAAEWVDVPAEVLSNYPDSRRVNG
jgi:hypothetical protein